MSKSLGNSPDPIELMEKYGADGVRLGMLLCSAAGNDILFDESQVEQGRNFCNKIWNAYRLVCGWTVDAAQEQTPHARLAVDWFQNKLYRTMEVVNDHFEKFRISDALMTLYKLFWDDFCAWYLEVIKPEFGKPIDKTTFDQTIGFFDTLLRLLHPIMPFITEELWQNLAERQEGETIMLAQQPQVQAYDAALIDRFETGTATIAALRNVRQSKGLSPKEALKLVIKGNFPEEILPVVARMANLSETVLVEAFDDEAAAGASFMVGTIEFRVPLTGLVNEAEEAAKITAEIERLEKFLQGVRAKLSNEKFVNHAPEQVVAMERKKESDALTKLTNLKEQLCKFTKA